MCILGAIHICHGSRHHSSVSAATMQIWCACKLTNMLQLNMCLPKVERQGCHAPAPPVAVSDASASGAMHVDQDEEVEDETRLHEFQNTVFVPWPQGLSVTELDALGETKGTILVCELEKSPNERIC